MSTDTDTPDEPSMHVVVIPQRDREFVGEHLKSFQDTDRPLHQAGLILLALSSSVPNVRITLPADVAGRAAVSFGHGRSAAKTRCAEYFKRKPATASAHCGERP
jgi:hypothetical protein